jgi:hypothetical protein
MRLFSPINIPRRIFLIARNGISSTLAIRVPRKLKNAGFVPFPVSILQ